MNSVAEGAAMRSQQQQGVGAGNADSGGLPVLVLVCVLSRGQQCPAQLGQGNNLGQSRCRAPATVCISCTAATTSVGLYCRGETARLEPDPGLVGDWLAAANCDPGTAICGYRQQVEAQNAFGDDSALNEVDFACCPSM